jgi:hypothetical protein
LLVLLPLLLRLLPPPPPFLQVLMRLLLPLPPLLVVTCYRCYRCRFRAAASCCGCLLPAACRLLNFCWTHKRRERRKWRERRK